MCLAHGPRNSILSFLENCIAVDVGLVVEAPLIVDSLDTGGLVDVFEVVLPGSVDPSEVAFWVACELLIPGGLGVERVADVAHVFLVAFGAFQNAAGDLEVRGIDAVDREASKCHKGTELTGHATHVK